MTEHNSGEEESIDLERRDVRALTEHTSVLSGFGDSGAGEYEVVSQSGKQYHVDVLAGTCTCPDHEYNNQHCKHLRGVEFATGRREIPAWVDREAINNTLGYHIGAGPVFAADADAADATETRALADGGTVVSETKPQVRRPWKGMKTPRRASVNSTRTVSAALSTSRGRTDETLSVLREADVVERGRPGTLRPLRPVAREGSMNAHALAATTTRQPDGWPTTEEWIAHTAAVTLAWSALDREVRRVVVQ